MHLDRAGRKLSQDGQMGIRREDTLLVVSPFIKKTKQTTKKHNIQNLSPLLFALFQEMKDFKYEVPSSSSFLHPTLRPLAVAGLQLLAFSLYVTSMPIYYQKAIKQCHPHHLYCCRISGFSVGCLNITAGPHATVGQ